MTNAISRNDRNGVPRNLDNASNAMALKPTSVSVEIVRGCNLDCPMCLTERNDAKVRRMEPDIYNIILFQIRQMDGHTLRFCGDGEQSLHPLFPEFVARACAVGISTVGIVTNGTRLSTQLIRKLYEAGLGFVAISVDAVTEETYRKIRRGHHTLAEVEKNIRLLLKRREEWGWNLEIQVNFVVQPLNVSEVEAFHCKWSSLVDQVNLLRLTSQTASRVDEFGVFEPCYMLRKKLYISVDGDIYPCFYLYKPIPALGNVRDTSIEEVWNRRRAQASQDPTSIFTPLCAQCTYTDQHWRPGAPVMPHNLSVASPLVSIRVFKGNSEERTGSTRR